MAESVGVGDDPGGGPTLDGSALGNRTVGGGLGGGGLGGGELSCGEPGGGGPGGHGSEGRRVCAISWPCTRGFLLALALFWLGELRLRGLVGQ